MTEWRQLSGAQRASLLHRAAVRAAADETLPPEKRAAAQRVLVMASALVAYRARQAEPAPSDEAMPPTAPDETG